MLQEQEPGLAVVPLAKQLLSAWSRDVVVSVTALCFPALLPQALGPPHHCPHAGEQSSVACGPVPGPA